jgi:hypothetical protein
MEALLEADPNEFWFATFEFFFYLVFFLSVFFLVFLLYVKALLELILMNFDLESFMF